AAVSGQAAVTFSASALDGCAGTVSVTCVPASGSSFPLGTTTVTCTAADGNGNTDTASFSVTVKDTTKPVVSVPADITAECTGSGQAAVTFSASASDVCAGPLAATCVPASGSSFPLGATTVTCTANDGNGNSDSASFTVTVV